MGRISSLKTNSHLQAGLRLGGNSRALSVLWRRIIKVGAWIGLVLSPVLLFVGGSHVWARGPDVQSASALVLGPPYRAKSVRHSLVIVDDKDVQAGIRWAGEWASNYATNAVVLRDGILTASSDTTVSSSYVAALIGESKEVHLAVDELHIAPNAMIRLPGVRLSIDATRVVIAGSLDVSGGRAGSLTIEADDVEIASTGRIRANGDLGGGDVFVGGQWQGSGSLRAARRIVMAPGSRIDTSAREEGGGGTVVLWANPANTSAFVDARGEIVSRGGRRFGNGP